MEGILPFRNDLIFPFIESLIAVLLIAISVGLLPSFDIIKVIQSQFNRRTNEINKRKEIVTQIGQITEEMAKLSPASDFAKYFKCERKLKKLEYELVNLDNMNARRSFVNNVKIKMAIKVLFIITPLFLAWHSNGGFTIAQIDQRWLFPFNLFIPTQLLSVILGNRGSPVDVISQDFGLPKTMITFFDFALIMLTVKGIYHYRINFNQRK